MKKDVIDEEILARKEALPRLANDQGSPWIIFWGVVVQ
jgi:hypothetical protein